MSENTHKLLKEATALLEKSQLLKETAIWLNDKVMEECAKTPIDEIENMSWEEKETAYNKLTELNGRLVQSLKDLARVDKEFRALRLRVNETYGREVIKDTPPIDVEEIIRRAEEGEGF